MSSKLLSFITRVLKKNKPSSAKSRNSAASEAEIRLGIGALVNGRYRLDAEIGRGGMGIVFRAHDLLNKQDVAIKVMNIDKANVLSRQQFFLEAEISSRFNHPHIVHVFETGIVDSGADESLPFIAMELVNGTNLANRHGLTYARIIGIGIQICEALQYTHDQGFVYRDLKPGNVLIEKHGFQYFVKLTDFGLARPRGVAYLDRESSLAGSFFYLAPELISGQPADIGSDLYALGATLYEMITGRVPFSNFDEKTILSQHLEEAVAPLSQSRHDVPPALEAIVLRLLAKKPEDRFASAQEVCYALEQITLTKETAVVLTNLPPLSTEPVEDQNEITQVKQLLETNRLVTLLGEGETLALAIGGQLVNQFSDGVWWVELAGLDDPALVLQTVSSVLGIRPDPRRSLTVSLIEYLREKNLLLVLSHCDRLLGACVQLVETLLQTCPDVRILATSHQALNVSHEMYHRLTI